MLNLLYAFLLWVCGWLFHEGLMSRERRIIEAKQRALESGE